VCDHVTEVAAAKVGPDKTQEHLGSDHVIFHNKSACLAELLWPLGLVAALTNLAG
jgi:hypothetical protein